jgi:hypothetical protein
MANNNNEINKLTKKDVVVIWGGAMDIAKNEADKGLTHLLKFVGECTNTNVIVVGAPKRHDLRESSCVNKEVDRFNRQLHKRLMTCEHAKVIDSVIWKEYYTKHGLHLNNGHKEQMARLIIDQIKYLETTNTNPPPPPIQLPQIEAISKSTSVNSDPRITDQTKCLEITNITPPPSNHHGQW